MVWSPRAGLPVLLGALAAAALAVPAIALVHRAARLEAGAATGPVFTVLFALGLVRIETTGAREVDLDCVLFGQLETLVRPAAEGWHSFHDLAALASAPRRLALLAGVAALAALVVAALWRPPRLLCFDRDYAAAPSLGLPARGLEAGLSLLVPAAVAAFESVGSVLVVALLVCLAAALRCGC